MPTTTKPRIYLCKDWEARAFREGRKTQVRIPIKHLTRIIEGDDDAIFEFSKNLRCWNGGKSCMVSRSNMHLYCPLGPVGSRVLGKEAFSFDHKDFYPHYSIVYRADDCWDFERNKQGEVYSPESKSWHLFKWQPAARLSDHYCRLFLTLAEVRVEELHKISAKDIIAEGVVDRPHYNELGKCPVSAVDKCCYPDLLSCYAAAWDSKHGKGSFQKTKHVFVCTLNRAEGE
jgi:hypothetical protein